MKRVLLCLLGVGLMATSTVTFAQNAQEANQTPRFEENLDVRATPVPDVPIRGSIGDHYLTFSGPVSVPGVTLKADTYVFRFPEGPGTNVIQVLTSDRSEALAMFQAIPTHNMARDLFSDGEVVLEARGAGSPMAIKEWYPSGRTTGYEFLYES